MTAAVMELEEEIVPQLELDEDTLVELDEEEEPKSHFQRKEEKKRVIPIDSIHSIIEKTEKLSDSKTILILLSDVSDAKEILQILREKYPDAKRTPTSVGKVSVAFNQKHVRDLAPNFIVVYLEITLDFLNEMGKHFNFTKSETEEISNSLIKKDANRELCRKCKEESDDELPYGFETGLVEWKPQFNTKNEPIVDDNGDQLYVEFPEMACVKGHRWYKGEGARRNVKGKNPILLDSHYKMRQQREIYVDIGTPDPSYTRDRFDQPTQGIFIRTHPSGRKTNTPEQRKSSGASFYR